ncbi:MAG: PAS domain-containing protein [Rubrivivax sp.]|nr:PAS domain-containing protein [Rubrivivax sp.]
MSEHKPPQDLDALSDHAPALAAVVAQVASDVALVIDTEGVIRSVADGGAALSPSLAGWVGRRWVDTATPDSQRKLQSLLEEARQGTGAARRREINHPGPGGNDIPVAWSAIRLGLQGPVVAVGRDLRAVVAIQQRFLAAQQDLERDYWRRRETENRYQRLFQVASDAVLVLDASSHEVLECNDTARALFPGAGPGAAQGHGLGEGPAWPWTSALPRLARAAVAELLVGAAASGRAAEIRVRALADGGACAMSATPFRVGDRLQLLVRARRELSGGAEAADLRHAAQMVETTPDAVVVTDSSGHVQLANPAFVALVDRGDESHLRGLALAELTGDQHGRWADLLERARTQGMAQIEPLHLNVGAVSTAARVSAALLTDGEQESVGFVMQVLSPGASRPVEAPPPWTELADAASRLGSAPLESLMTEVTQAAERHLVKRAWTLSAGRIDECAALLGLSLNGLRSRLQQLGLDESGESMASAPRAGTTH